MTRTGLRFILELPVESRKVELEAHSSERIYFAFVVVRAGPHASSPVDLTTRPGTATSITEKAFSIQSGGQINGCFLGTAVGLLGCPGRDRLPGKLV